MKVVIALLGLVVLSAGVQLPGRCSDDNAQAVPNFDLLAYMGTWYDVQRYPIESQKGDCSSAYYEFYEQFGLVSVFNTIVVGGQVQTINGSAGFSTNEGSAKFLVTFPIEGFVPALFTQSPYWVLDTDYNGYAMVYSCRDLNNGFKNVSAWKLSRTRSLSDELNAKIDAVIARVPSLDQIYFRTTDYSSAACAPLKFL